MKKIFKLMTIALVAMCGFTACDNDCEHDFIEHDFSKALVGTWTCMDMDYAEALVINADGTLTATGVVDGEFFESKGTIKVVNNKMIYKLDNGDEWEGRFEMTTGESFTMVWDDELDIRYTYRYCENDLSDEIVGMWVSTQETFGQKNGSVAINTFNEDGKAYVTAFVPEIDSYINQGESDYKVIGNMLITWVKYDPNLPELYTAIEIDIIPNGTELGDIMTSYNPVYGTTVSFLRVKEGLNLTGKTYDYNSAYVTNAKGTDEDFTMLGHTFNMANINAGNFDMMFRSELFCVDLNANSITQRFRANGRDIEIEIPITVEGNKVTLDLSTENPAYREVDMYMFQDADDCQLHMYMHTDAFINYFANMELYNLLASGEITSDAAAVEKVFTDMEARIESINVSFVLKARE